MVLKKAHTFLGGKVVNDRMFWGYHHNFSIRLNSITSNVQNGTKCYVYLFSSLLTAQVFSRNSEQNMDAVVECLT